ncbi:MAG TPA: polyhydroxyalkanoate synthesis regulator DNA-binding domain-containing protein [Thermodesulfobacteriota bacterium]|nr:polyhydroxyalkanoate synthesis regulator DNA-binding domain-containing protein [Thermodesulfobacteriota bacterium]
MADQQIIIKKYSNRRLYDTTHKRYVTLDEIAELIKQGNEIKVIDSQTDEDITRVILIQVILESEKHNADILPISFLHMLIKYGNKMARDFFENYFLIMFQPYLSFQENMKKNLRRWQESSWFPPGLGSQSPYGKPGSPWETLAKELEKQNSKTGEQEEHSLQSDRIAEMQALIERIKELEEEVKSIKTQSDKRKEAEK